MLTERKLSLTSPMMAAALRAPWELYPHRRAKEAASCFQRAPSLRGVSAARHRTPTPAQSRWEWDDSTESDIFGYAVYVSRSSNGPFVRQAWLLSDSAYADGRTTDGASYYYTVAAINSWGLESPKSSVLRVPSQDITPPEPPSGLSVEVGDRSSGNAQLSWDASPSADLSGYRVYRQGEEGPRSPVTALLFAPAFEDRTLPQEGVFSYSVTAIDLSRKRVQLVQHLAGTVGLFRFGAGGEAQFHRRRWTVDKHRPRQGGH